MKRLQPKLLLQMGFLTGIALLLLCSLGKTFLFPKDINTYENRKANQPPSLSISGFLSSRFQDDLEDALSDQVLGAQTLKHKYSILQTDLSFYTLRGFYAAHPNRYFHYNQISVFNSDYLLYEPRALTEDSQKHFDRKLASIANTARSHPELDYHVFYIEKDTDRNFETEESCGNYNYIAAHSAPELYDLTCYAVDSFRDFAEYFYQTDHHWNHIGSYKGYVQLCRDMGLSDPLEKGEEFLVANRLTGSKRSLVNYTDAFSESMYAYHFDFPSMEITVNGEAVEDYGQQNQDAQAAYASRAPMTYSRYYGADMGEVIFTTADEEKENILVFGDSYDNAILKLLATHFHKTCSVDLRYYEHYMGKPFDFSAYVSEHEIDRVLFIGNIDFFFMDEFNLGG